MKQNDGGEGSESTRQPAAAGPGLTRSQAAERLGTSVASIRRMEGKTLNPTKGPDGVYRFDPAEVDGLTADSAAPSPARLRRSDAGELAAQAFVLFDNRLTPRQVVIELRQPPEVIEKLHRQWREGTGLWVPSSAVARLRKAIELRRSEKSAVRLATAQELEQTVMAVLQGLDFYAARADSRAAQVKRLRDTVWRLERRVARQRDQMARWVADEVAQVEAEEATTGAQEGEQVPPAGT